MTEPETNHPWDLLNDLLTAIALAVVIGGGIAMVVLVFY